MKFIYFFSALLILFSCKSVEQNSTDGLVSRNQLKYAKGFALEQKGGITYIDVYNPWNNNSVIASYTICSDSLNENCNIRVPVQRLASLSSTYLGMLSLLDARESVVATSNANWICDSVLYSNYVQGNVINLGNDLSISAEAVIAQKPNVVLKYIYQSPDPIDPVIEGSGIPVIYLIEFMEEHPLGKAEWIKLVGALLNKEKEADSIFNDIEKKYKYYTELAGQSKSRPTVLCGSVYKGTWYAAGGSSHIAQLLYDANADYYWQSDTTTGSLSLALESVIQHQKEADYWINANAYTLDELVTVEPRSNVFKAFEDGNVYHYNKLENTNGGLDYYEMGVVRPDVLLRDLLVILHPDLLDAETVYYRKLD